MDRGIIVATIGQQPEKQGALPLQILYDYIGLGIVPKEKYLTELSIRIKQNIWINNSLFLYKEKPYIKPQTYEKWKKRSLKKDISKRENQSKTGDSFAQHGL